MRAIDVAFSPGVKAVQERLGSRGAYAERDLRSLVTKDLEAFLAECRSFYLATASADGQPYVQHRGGPKGFLRVLDAQRLAFADFAGNRQYISLGNLEENPKVALILTDYARRRRLKIWGEVQVVEDDPALLARLAIDGYHGKPERAFVVHVRAWDLNCPQHIPRLVDADTVDDQLVTLKARIAGLEAELQALHETAARGDHAFQFKGDGSR